MSSRPKYNARGGPEFEEAYDSSDSFERKLFSVEEFRISGSPSEKTKKAKRVRYMTRSA